MTNFKSITVDLSDNDQLELANTIIKAKDSVIVDIVQEFGPDIKEIIYHLVMSVAANKKLKTELIVTTEEQQKFDFLE